MRNLKTAFLCLAVAATAACMPERATAETFYLAPDGNDANDGRTPSTPKRKMMALNPYLKAGSKVYLKGGKYLTKSAGDTLNTWVTRAGGTEAEPITVMAYPGEKPVLSGPGTYETFWVISGNWIVVDGITFEDFHGYFPLDINNASHVVIRNCSFLRTPSTQIRIYTSSYVTIEKSRFDTAGAPERQGDADHIYVCGSDHIAIQDNYFTQAGHSTIDFIEVQGRASHHNVFRRNTIDQYWGGGVYIVRGSHHILVSDNTIRHAGEKVLDYIKEGVQIAGSYNIIRRNLIAFTSASPQVDDGIDLASYNYGGAKQEASYNRIYNNVVYKAGGKAVVIAQKNDLETTDNIFFNNIFYYNTVAGEGKGEGQGEPVYILYDTYHSPNRQWKDFPHGNALFNNLILHATRTGPKPKATRLIHRATRGGDDDPLTLANAQKRYPNGFAGNIATDPMFKDAERSDFSLLQASQAIDAGKELARTTAAGSGVKDIPVDDVRSFCDGFGIIEGDTIRIGANSTQILEVNEKDKVLRVKTPVTFAAGERIYAPYNGAAPDLGAIESAFTRTAAPAKK